MNQKAEIYKTNKPENFIPYLRKDLIDMCVDDGRLPEDQVQEFRDFCEILTSYSHYEFHHDQEMVKNCFAPFDPDRDIVLKDYSEKELKQCEENVVESFRALAKHANFHELPRKELLASFNASDLIQLNTSVELEDFDQLECYVRGDITKVQENKTLFGKKEIQVRTWQRVLLLLKFKGKAYFDSKKGSKGKDLPFQPGRMYVYFYKDVPALDLELLFPNVEVSMTLKDRLFFSVPAVGGGIAALIKIVPQLLIIAAALAFLLGQMFGDEVYTTMQSWFHFPDGDLNAMRILIAVMGMCIVLGGLAFKQWTAYKGKRIKFLKDVSETLFFRNLATNQSVFHRVIDIAEEEECKEMLLVYYHLMVNQDKPMTAPELDALIEKWMEKNFETVIDFDIDGPVKALKKVVGHDRNGEEKALLSVDEKGYLHILPLEDAKNVVDYLWDNAYLFNKE